jgi:hypothetical protein
MAFNHINIIIGEFAPTGFDLAFNLLGGQF